MTKVLCVLLCLLYVQSVVCQWDTLTKKVKEVGHSISEIAKSGARKVKDGLNYIFNFGTEDKPVEISTEHPQRNTYEVYVMKDDNIQSSSDQEDGVYSSEKAAEIGHAISQILKTKPDKIKGGFADILIIARIIKSENISIETPKKSATEIKVTNDIFQPNKDDDFTILKDTGGDVKGYQNEKEPDGFTINKDNAGDEIAYQNLPAAFIANNDGYGKDYQYRPSPIPTTPPRSNSALPDPPICGYNTVQFTRIINGIPAKLGELPWMALLGYEVKYGPLVGTTWMCGGTLISSRHVLTAAHCIHNHEDDLYVVRLGELDLDRDDEGATPVDILIKEKIKHEDFIPNPVTNDIGILLLTRATVFTNLIRPICIPKGRDLSFENYKTALPLIAGWGSTKYNGTAATHLQIVQLPLLRNEFCARRYASNSVDERVLCAGYRNGRKDACEGDSGGPLMQPLSKILGSSEPHYYFYQIGIISYGKECAKADYPGVYTSVLYFASWIEDTVAEYS